MRARTQRTKARRKTATKLSKTSPHEMRCDWCGNLIAAHTRELLNACRSHVRQLWSGGRFV